MNGNNSLVSMKTRCRRAAGLLPESDADCLDPSAVLLALNSDFDDVLYADAAMAAPGQTAERQYAVLTEPVDELTRHPEHLGRSRRTDLVLGAENDDS